MNFFKNARSDFLQNPRELQRASLPCWFEPAKNIVQNHLNIALLNVFYYVNGRYKHIFMSKNFSYLRIS